MYWIEDEGLAMWKIESAYVKSLTGTSSVHDKIVISGGRSRAIINVYALLPEGARNLVDMYPDDSKVAELIELYEKVVIKIIAGVSGRRVLSRDSIKNDITNYVKGGNV